MFLIFYFVGHAGILALGALLPNKSIFFAINIMIFGAALLLSSFMRTLMTELLNAFALTGVSKTFWVFDHLIILEAGFFALFLIVLYATKDRGGSV